MRVRSRRWRLKAQAVQAQTHFFEGAGEFSDDLKDSIATVQWYQ
jgi:hypothetical protein